MEASITEGRGSARSVPSYDISFLGNSITGTQSIMRTHISSALSLLSLLWTSSKDEQLQPHTSLPPSLDLLQTSISDLGAFLANNTLTSVDLVEAYLGKSESS